MSDLEMLREYVRTGSGEAFGGVVREHIGWVYSAAARLVRNRELAEDVTQGVFIALAKRARGMTLDEPLSPWLFRVVRYAAASVLRAEGRRRRHEREAAMISEQTPQMSEREWEELSPMLDELVGKLGDADQRAVLLRFYEQKSFGEVGKTIGVSEEAARKRIGRAVEKLRGMFARRGVAVGSGALVLGMGTRVVEAVDGGLAAATTQATLAGIGSGQGFLIAEGAMHMMAWAKAKLAAVVVIGVMVMAGVGAAIATKRAGAAKTGSATGGGGALAVVNEVEAKAQGEVQVARWDVILNQAGADVVKKVGTGMASGSVVYAGMVCNGMELRRAVTQANVIGGVEQASEMMEMAHGWPPGGKALRFAMGPSFSYSGTGPQARVMIVGGSNQNEKAIERLAGDRLSLKLDYAGMKVNINERTDRWRWAGDKPAAIVFDGELGAGEAVAFVGQFAAASGRPYYHLVVWETFKAEQEQMTCISSQHDAVWWCENGPGQMRRWADAARVWMGQATHEPSAVSARFETTLDDGKVVRLVGLCRPAEWPFCWWDAEGNPVAGYNGMVYMRGEPPAGLWAAVEVVGKAEEYKLKTPMKNAPNFGVGEYRDVQCASLREGETELQVGVLVGLWKELGKLEMGKPMTAAGVTYAMDRPAAIGATSFLVHLTREGVLEHADFLTAIGMDGTESQGMLAATIVYGRNGEERVVNSQPNFCGLPLATVKEFRLHQRKREWVTFSGFATEPKLKPKAVVSQSEVLAAEKERLRKQEEAKLEELKAKRRGWAAVTASPTSELGVMRMLVDAVRIGDEKAVRGMLTAKDPAMVRQLDTVARVLVIEERLRRMAVERFGELAVTEQLDRFAEFHDVEAELMGGQWKKTADGAMEVSGFVVRKDREERCYLDLDELGKQRGLEEFMTGVLRRAGELERMMGEKEQVTIEEVKAVVEQRR